MTVKVCLHCVLNKPQSVLLANNYRTKNDYFLFIILIFRFGLPYIRLPFLHNVVKIILDNYFTRPSYLAIFSLNLYSSCLNYIMFTNNV